MVRVSSASSSASKSKSTAITRIRAAVPFVIPSWYLPRYHRDVDIVDYRSKIDRGRRGRRSLWFPFVAVLMLVISLPWYISSFLVMESNSSNTHDLLWTSCPSDHGSEGGNVGKGDDICFVTCIFGASVGDVDRPANVEWFDHYWCHARFLLVTNLPDLPAPGWTKIVTNTNTTTTAVAGDADAAAVGTPTAVEDATITQTHIVQSRHAKFLAWEALPTIVPQHCAAVVYMDGYLTPVRYTSWWSMLSALVSTPPWSPASPLFLGSFTGAGHQKRQHRNQVPPPRKFQNLVQQVRTHPWGLSQVKQKYYDGLPMATLLQNLVRDRKDTEDHVEKTLEWFRSQTTDFREIMPYYLNKYFAYDPNNAKYRELSSFFWRTYTTYGGLWRDQPLWAYLLHHFNVTPAVMTTKGTITKGGDLFQTGGKLGWDKHVYT